MYQQEIQFFWPLTEQIPLELDYTDCAKPKLCVDVGVTAINYSFQGTITSVVNTSGLEIRSGTITIKDDKMPWYRKVMFKLMGFKW